MTTPVDLRELAAAPAAPRGGRHWLSRYVLPGAIVLGFLALVGWAARNSFLPAQPVTVVPVVATRAVVQEAGAPLFVAAGWVEPRPTPILVTALAEGVVEQLLVVEGQEVKAGEAVARLIDADARLALAAGDADLKQREAEADAILAKSETDLVFIPFQIQAAEAQERVARIDLEGKQAGRGSIPEISIARAQSELTAASARVAELKVRKQRLDREVAAMRQMRDAIPKGAPVPTDASRLLTEGEANMKTALTRIAQAQVAVDTARLRLDRMTVRAPVAGRVLGLVARPGSRLMGMTPGAAHDASTVVSLYDPRMLQVRADVRFEDLPGVQEGQPVRIESPALPRGAVEGQVLLVTSIADIQKNTLQVKVVIAKPPPVLKPDMLVQATFLAPPVEGARAGTETLRLLVPRSLVESGPGSPRVWVADQAAGVARHRPIQLGPAVSADMVEVTDGLTAADKLIVAGREGLADGARITISGEDASLGTTAAPAGGKAPRLQRLPGAGHEGKH